jgi:hypothetical protein
MSCIINPIAKLPLSNTTLANIKLFQEDFNIYIKYHCIPPMRTHSLKRNANVSLLSVFKLVIHCITTFLHLVFLMCSPFDQGAAVAVIVWQLDLLI